MKHSFQVAADVSRRKLTVAENAPIDVLHLKRISCAVQAGSSDSINPARGGLFIERRPWEIHQTPLGVTRALLRLLCHCRGINRTPLTGFRIRIGGSGRYRQDTPNGVEGRHPGEREDGCKAPAAVRGYLAISLISLCCLLHGLYAHAQSLNPEKLSRIAFDQKLDAQVSLSLPFRDEAGRTVKLGDYFHTKPVILVLGYYECPMLCTLTLNGMVESLEDIKWNIGNQFDVVNVSINPRETPALAAAKKKSYLRRYGRAGAEQGWHFLTGDQPAITALTDEVGFHYAYDPTVKQYAHPSGLIILTPRGRVAKYLFGVKFAPEDLYTALSSASGNQIGTRIQQLVLLCFHYSPIKGKYGQAIMVGVRILGAATLIGLVWLIAYLLRLERGRVAPSYPPGASGLKSRVRTGTPLAEDAGRQTQDPRLKTQAPPV